MPHDCRETIRFRPALEATSIAEPELRALYKYWDAKRGERAMPARADLDPVCDVPRLVPFMQLVEVAERVADFRIRLFGTALCDGFGDERTGRRLGELTYIENFEEVFAVYDEVRRQGVPIYTPGRTVSTARDYRSYSRLLLPLAADGVHTDLLLGGMVFFRKSSPIGR
jgi:hypothetical protein